MVTNSDPQQFQHYSDPGQITSGLLSATTSTSMPSVNYSYQHTVPDLEVRINDLEKELKEKSHLTVAKDQEERICELERVITELMDKIKSMHVWIERREQERCEELEGKLIRQHAAGQLAMQSKQPTPAMFKPSAWQKYITTGGLTSA